MVGNFMAVVVGSIAFLLPYVLPKLFELDKHVNYGLVIAK